jgi:DUF4097 and DUF4098 domain-containing protein YvlB
MNGYGPRRGSIFAGLLLVLVGALLLIHNLQPGLLHLGQIARYWPVLLILWGLARLWDHMAARRTGQVPPRTITGSDLLLVLLVLVGVVAIIAYDRIRSQTGGWDTGIGLFDNSYTFTSTLPAEPVEPSSRIELWTPRGNITVRPQPAQSMNVVVTKTVDAPSRDDAQKTADQTTVSVDKTAQGLHVGPKFASSRGNVRVSYDVNLFPKAAVSATTGRGEIHIRGIDGEITTSASGDVEVSDSGANTTIDLRRGDVHVHSAAGNVTVNGRGEQIDLGEIRGSASIHGEFYGPIRVRRVAKNVQFISRRTSLTLAELPGRLELDSGRLLLSDTTGSVGLETRDKDVTFENVQGPIRIVNRNGDIEIRYTQPPRNNIDVTNGSGNIELVLPDRSAFSLSAVARSGEISSDLQAPALKLVKTAPTSSLEGTVGSGGPSISLTTSYGTIHIRRTPMAPPIPPVPPTPPSTPKPR